VDVRGEEVDFRRESEGWGTRKSDAGKMPALRKRKADPWADFDAQKLLIRHSDWRMTFARRRLGMTALEAGDGEILQG
jgi:hypothetical protein